MANTSGPNSERRVAVVGGGPIGVETALLFVRRGYDVTVFEAGREIGAHVEQWGHVQLFSPWRLNRSPWGAAAARAVGLEEPDLESFPTGAQYLREYLRPLAAHALGPRVRTGRRVIGVSRSRAWKGDLLGRPERADVPFIIASDGEGGRAFEEYDVAIDATGTFATPAALGIGGLAAAGESDAASLITRRVPDIVGRERALFEGRHVLVVGQGHSAATSLGLLVRLREVAPETSVSWLRRDATPYDVIDDDPLPQRRALSEFANRAAEGGVAGITALPPGAIVRLDNDGSKIRVLVRHDGGESQHLTVDRIISNVGYRPDLALTRELQVHHCYASEGPMKLAASLLAQSGSSDCLTQEAGGVDTLRNPEPNFFVVGSKSYGRNPNFLLRVGFEHVESIVDALDVS